MHGILSEYFLSAGSFSIIFSALIIVIYFGGSKTVFRYIVMNLSISNVILGFISFVESYATGDAVIITWLFKCNILLWLNSLVHNSCAIVSEQLSPSGQKTTIMFRGYISFVWITSFILMTILNVPLYLLHYGYKQFHVRCASTTLYFILDLISCIFNCIFLSVAVNEWNRIDDTTIAGCMLKNKIQSFIVTSVKGCLISVVYTLALICEIAHDNLLHHWQPAFSVSFMTFLMFAWNKKFFFKLKRKIVLLKSPY
ncbi:hypothetical protein HELRODRAFT_167345 [Helobdella robusta]|uniref:Uncharacterized protein n=1 Tax=Helobdella robusta TaxID=6412 RepID=T1EZA2_HELRO|nr:hypothetical protein HELRODRAFT_167345 [Helobdella robusta]ESO10842.1 hypothetical protein HELRODRAFT_167345 [Helobdella robusta]